MLPIRFLKCVFCGDIWEARTCRECGVVACFECTTRTFTGACHHRKLQVPVSTNWSGKPKSPGDYSV